ncbi:MAG: hypothetical protein AAGI52_16885 [Bacteroidota bacterium]
MKPLVLALLVLAPLATAAQDSTQTAASASWLDRMAREMTPRPMQWTTHRLTLRAVRFEVREGQREEVTFTPLLALPPQVRRSRDDEE